MEKTHIKYCLPIAKNSRDLVLKTINEHIHEYDYFEVWFDQVKDINDEFVSQLQQLLQDRLIIKMPGKWVDKFAASPVLVDLDITAIKKSHSNINLITSYHNYKETPTDQDLAKIVEQMSAYKPRIYKIATNCEKPQDAVRLLNLLLTLKQQGLKCIVIGMGELGKLTRVAGVLWGNEFTFAPLVESEKTAEGQLTKSQLELILQELNR